MPEAPIEDLHLVVVRRANLQMLFPMNPDGLRDTTPFEIARAAILYFEKLQVQNPGRAEEPIIPQVPYGLMLPLALGPLDPEMFLWYQLEGRWQDLSLSVQDVDLPHTTPTVVLNLMQLNNN